MERPTPSSSFDSPDPAPQGQASPEEAPARGAHEQGHDPDETAALIDQLQSDIERLRSERDAAEARYKQSLAEFANYQRRALSNEQQASAHGVRKVLESVIPVLDHFDMALGQNPDTASASSVIEGVTMIKQELLRALGAQGVAIICPSAGDEFEPTLHKAIVQQPSDSVPPGRVVQTLRQGFALGERVVRPAEVIVAS